MQLPGKSFAAVSDHARLPNTTEWLVHTQRGEYLVQVAWPLSWNEDRTGSEDDVADIVYLVDGNAYFYTAVDISRRLEYLNSSRTIIVGIGYPPGKRVYDFRRGPDLTPWAPEYDMPLNKEGKPRTDISFGEADDFLTWIHSDVMPHVEDTLFAARALTRGRRALFGHSYGGIFTLNAMYTKPGLFDTYIAASPITWWNKDYLIRELEPKFRDLDRPFYSPVSLVLSWGGSKSDMVRFDGESEAVFRKRQSCAEADEMSEYAEALAGRMRQCRNIRNVQTRSLPYEDHGSAAVAGLQYGLTAFILEPREP
ncbi:esterase [Sarocladium implicatum]|nr:esterase [Sarocladium implicatum]